MELVHPVPVEEAEPWLVNLITALLGTPSGESLQRRVDRLRAEWEPERTWGVRDGGRWVATLGTFARAITIPGTGGTCGELITDALTRVSVAATHRRRGLLRRMLTESLAAAADRGDPLAILVAAEWPIYGRYGYAQATRAADYRLYPRRAGASVAPDPSGFVRQLDAAELGPLAGAIFDRSRRRWAGQVDRPGGWWSREFGLDGHEPAAGFCSWVLHEGPDGPDGLLGWKVAGDVDFYGVLGKVEVTDLVAASDLAYRNLWSYLTSLDLVSEIMLRDRPIDEPVRWLLSDGRALRHDLIGDHTWLRFLDVPAALSARGYATSGQVVLEVVDDDAGGWAAGRYLLDASTDGASCSPTTRSADLVVPQRALAGAYLGDHSLRELSIAGGVDELTPRALDRVDALLATSLRPWNPTGF